MLGPFVTAIGALEGFKNRGQCRQVLLLLVYVKFNATRRTHTTPRQLEISLQVD